jgi:hypothetical protein
MLGGNCTGCEDDEASDCPNDGSTCGDNRLSMTSSAPLAAFILSMISDIGGGGGNDLSTLGGHDRAALVAVGEVLSKLRWNDAPRRLSEPRVIRLTQLLSCSSRVASLDRTLQCSSMR